MRSTGAPCIKPRCSSGRRDAPHWCLGLLLALAAVVLLQGCATLRTEKRLQTLDETLRNYSRAVRWGYYPSAAQFIQTREGITPVVDLALLQQIRVTSYDVLNTVVSPDQMEASVDAQISYYHEESGHIQTLRDHQDWWFSEEQQRWWLDGTLPDFIPASKSGQ